MTMLREQLEAMVGDLDPETFRFFEALENLHRESGVLVIVEDLDLALEEAARKIRALREASDCPMVVSATKAVDFPGGASSCGLLG